LRFHTDRCDVIAFLCIQPAQQGGETFIVSSAAVYDELRRRHPQALEILKRPFPYLRHTVDSGNQLPYCELPVFSEREGHFAAHFLRVLIDRADASPDAYELAVDRLLASRGYTQVLWNLGTGDFQVRDSEAVLRTFTRVLDRRARENGERGGIVLLHDTHEWSVDAVPRIVGWLRDQNCALLEQEEELYDIVGEPRWFFAPRGDDASAEAPAAEPPPEVFAERQRRLREQTRRRCDRVASR